MLQYKLNWKPDKRDLRDFIYRSPDSANPLATLPKKVDLRKYCSAIKDQGAEGSCTANALGSGAMEYLENIERITHPKPYHDLSRSFLYFNEREIEGTSDQDSGAMLRDGIKSLATQGICKESACPYVVGDFAKKPSQYAYDEGATRKITSYSRILTLADMKGCLAEGHPFVFGFNVYAEFMGDAVAKTGIVPMPKPYEKEEGGHAVLAIGYDDATGYFKVRNSWGTAWGDHGYFYMPYAYLSDVNLATDMWTIRK